MKKTLLLMLCALLVLGACKTAGTTGAVTADTNQNSQLLDQFAQMRATEYYVKYDTNTVAEGRTLTGSMAQYFKNEHTMRMDFTSPDETGRSYLHGTTFTTCALEGSTWDCFAMEQSPDEIDAFRLNVEANIDQFDVRAADSRKIAGTTATCYTLNADDAVAEYCFSPEGVPLLISVTGPGLSSEMRATEYHLGVDDADLELPADSTVQTMDELMQQISSGFE